MYGTATTIPVEIGAPTLRRQLADMDLNSESLVVNLDISELRDRAKI